MIDYDYETKEILILNWHKYNWTKSPKFEVSLKKYANEIKNEKFRNHILSSYKQYTSDTVYRINTILIVLVLVLEIVLVLVKIKIKKKK